MAHRRWRPPGMTILPSFRHASRKMVVVIADGASITSSGQVITSALFCLLYSTYGDFYEAPPSDAPSPPADAAASHFTPRRDDIIVPPDFTIPHLPLTPRIISMPPAAAIDYQRHSFIQKCRHLSGRFRDRPLLFIYMPCRHTSRAAHGSPAGDAADADATFSADIDTPPKILPPAFLDITLDEIESRALLLLAYGIFSAFAITARDSSAERRRPGRLRQLHARSFRRQQYQRIWARRHETAHAQ